MIIVDRIENGLAICEVDDTMVDIPLSKISKDVKEGDVLKDNGNGVSYTVDAAMTKQRRDEIDTLFEKLKTKNKK